MSQSIAAALVIPLSLILLSSVSSESVASYGKLSSSLKSEMASIVEAAGGNSVYRVFQNDRNYPQLETHADELKDFILDSCDEYRLMRLTTKNFSGQNNNSLKTAGIREEER